MSKNEHKNHLAAMQQDTINLRDIPLEIIMEEFGATRDPKDPQKNYRHEQGRITVTQQKFYNHDQALGGGGAIDLTMHLGEMKFLEAKKYLEEAFPDKTSLERKTKIALAKRKEREDKAVSGIPYPHEEYLGAITNYLVNERKIPQETVEAHIRQKNIWADSKGNVVFALKDPARNIVGAELRGTMPDKTIINSRGEKVTSGFHGTRGEKGKGFFFSGQGSEKHICITEASIDALSYTTLFPQNYALGAPGSQIENVVNTCKTLLDAGYTIGLGHDDDRPGNQLADNIMESLKDHPLHANVSREKPHLSGCKDWNQALKRSTPYIEKTRPEQKKTHNSALQEQKQAVKRQITSKSFLER